MKKLLSFFCLVALTVFNAIGQQCRIQGIPHSGSLSEKNSNEKIILKSDKNFTFDDIKYWVGEGEKQAALVIEWHDGGSPDAIVWGYRWSGNASGLDMISAIANADSRLILLRQYTGTLGYTIDGIGYNCPNGSISYDFKGASGDSRVSFKFSPPYTMPNQKGHPSTPEKDVQDAISGGYKSGIIEHPFDAGTYGYPAYDYDYWKASSSVTHWDAGWYDGYWSYWVKDSQSDDFMYSGLGASSRQLVDGSWDGWSYSRNMDNWNGAEPGDSFVAATNPNGSSSVDVSGVSLNKQTLTITVGNKETLIATVSPSNADNKKITWSSNNEDIAKVDQAGKVTAVSAGKAIITVTTEDGHYTATCEVTVTAPEQPSVPVTGVTLNYTTSSLVIGQLKTLTATVSPSNADNKKATWNSDNEAIAKVDQAGKVTAVSAGKATITVTTEDGHYTATCEITATAPEQPSVPVTGVTLNYTTSSLDIGQSKTLTATISPSNADNKKTTWSSNNESIAKVDQAGKVVTVSVGNATITVTTEDGHYTATCEITVTAPEQPSVPVTGVTLDYTTSSLEIGQSKTLIATVFPSNADNKKITWNCDNETVAKVDQAGKVTAVSVGNATITVTTEDSHYTATCNILVKKNNPDSNEIIEKECCVYPTVTSDIVHISITKPTLIQLYDLSGRLIKSINAKAKCSISLQPYAKGFYFIKIENNVTKIIKK